MINKLMFVGHIGQDATVKDVNGKQVINFSVAHTETYTKADGVKVERTTWAAVSYWPKSTAVATYLKKGQLVYVEGNAGVEAYQNSAGKPAAALRLSATMVKLLGSSKAAQPAAPSPSGNGAAKTPAAPASEVPAELGADAGDDLPF